MTDSKYIGKRLPNFNQDMLELVDLNSPSTFNTINDYDLSVLWEAYEIANNPETTSDEAKARVVAIAAAIAMCPVPGNALIAYGGLSNWKEVAAAYISTKFIHSYIVDMLRKSDKPVHQYMISLFTSNYPRHGGNFRSTDWPVSKHIAEFDIHLLGHANPVSYSVSRIIRDGFKHFKETQQRGNLVAIYDKIMEINYIEDDVDLILKIGKIALELGVPRSIILKHIKSQGYLVEENGLNYLKDRIEERLKLPEFQLLSEAVEN